MRTACQGYLGGLPSGGGLPAPRHCGKADPYEQTNICENITFQQLHLQAVIRLMPKRYPYMLGCHVGTTLNNMHKTPKVSAEGYGHLLRISTKGEGYSLRPFSLI